MKHTTYVTTADILANAIISDSPEIMQLDQLDLNTKRRITNARRHGYHLVSVRWPGGQFALMFCEPGCTWPDPKKVVAAYQRCVQTSTVFPRGTHHEIS